ncbi:AAA family ATPase [Agrilactobacillus fermenti]|uniref:AAA family ATPase n=1 Tax=Agrilactobacillus fermenti TaxID=2586909 RepID=UPI001E4160F7|nr:AAA family ATPase [Agrilactobacillus fermenti]MCD2255358.1 kinase [Agrilactobacillus fermenti]
MANLIIIRGNSASGKTTTAKLIQKHLGSKTLLISQDVVRREMLATNDRAGNLSINLIQEIAAYGLAHCQNTIIEGILSKEVYGQMLCQLVRSADHTQAYYYDLPFEETVQRHQGRAKIAEFGEAELKRWWLSHDTLDIPEEKVIPQIWQQTKIVQWILERIP